MAHTNRLRSLYLTHFSKPPEDRPVYQVIRRHKVRSILELGLGTGQRAMRMIEAAASNAPPGDIQYTGVDLFESRQASDGRDLTLKNAHRLLRATGARVQLLPGDPFAALARVANRLGPIDLVVISHATDLESLDRAWFYLPRLLRATSLVLAETRQLSGEMAFRTVPLEHVKNLASKGTRRQAA